MGVTHFLKQWVFRCFLRSACGRNSRQQPVTRDWHIGRSGTEFLITDLEAPLEAQKVNCVFMRE